MDNEYICFMDDDPTVNNKRTIKNYFFIVIVIRKSHFASYQLLDEI